MERVGNDVCTALILITESTSGGMVNRVHLGNGGLNNCPIFWDHLKDETETLGYADFQAIFRGFENGEIHNLR